MHEHTHSTTGRLKLAFFLNFGFSIAEFIGGIFTNSIALMSDSIHDLGDSLSIAASWFFNRKATKKPDEKYTYGYGRYSLLGGLITAIVLLVGLVFLLMEAIPRLIHPEQIKVSWVLGFAVFGLIVNGIAAFSTSRGKTMSEKMVSLHLFEDVLGWAVLLISSIVMLFVDFPILDPLLSIGYAIFILIQVYKNGKELVGILIEKAPHNIDFAALKAQILAGTSIIGIHHVHIWSLDGNQTLVTFHAALNKALTKEQVIEVQKQVHAIVNAFGITHATIEFELDSPCQDEDCQLSENEVEEHHHHHH